MDEAGKCFQIKGTGGAKAQRQECQEPISTSLQRKAGEVAGRVQKTCHGD